MKKFKREVRYIVFKITDMRKYLEPHQIAMVHQLGSLIARGRNRDVRPPFNAAVVEQDWPEFEMVWAAIEDRVAQEEFDKELDRLHRESPTKRLSGLPQPVQCCERDTDHDGNCDRHPVPNPALFPVPWEQAGGPNECKHGYAQGIPCPHCYIEAQKRGG